jgi:hypothetical protein
MQTCRQSYTDLYDSKEATDTNTIEVASSIGGQGSPEDHLRSTPLFRLNIF